MRKIFALLFAVCMVLSVSSCGTAKPDITVIDSAFSCTPQEFIDGLNKTVTKANDSALYAVGTYPGNREELQVKSTALTLALTENSDGKLIKVHLYWYSGSNDENVIMSAGCYCGYITKSMTPGIANELNESIGQIISVGYGSTERTDSNVKISFEATKTGANYLDVSIVK